MSDTDRERIKALEVRQEDLDKQMAKLVTVTEKLAASVNALRVAVKAFVMVCVFASSTLAFFGWLLSHQYVRITIPG